MHTQITHISQIRSFDSRYITQLVKFSKWTLRHANCCSKSPGLVKEIRKQDKKHCLLNSYVPTSSFRYYTWSEFSSNVNEKRRRNAFIFIPCSIETIIYRRPPLDCTAYFLTTISPGESSCLTINLYSATEKPWNETAASQDPSWMG